MHLQHLQLGLLHLTNNVSWCCAAVRADWYCAADLFWWSVSFSSYCCNEALGLSVFVIYSAAQRDSTFPAGRRRRKRERKKQPVATFSSRLIERAQFTCVRELFAFFSSLCLRVRAKQTVTSDLINLSDQFLFWRVDIYLNMCRCARVLVVTRTLARADAHTLRTEDSAEISSSPRAVKYSVSTAQESQLDSLGGINSKHRNNALWNQINCL